MPAVSVALSQQEMSAAGPEATRVPGHFSANATFAVDLLRAANRYPRVSVRFDIEKVANSSFVVARQRVLAGAVFDAAGSTALRR